MRKIELTNSLLEMLRTGGYEKGARLPTSRELVERFDASMVTVSRAMKELRRMGVIEARPGSGYYMSSLPGGNVTNGTTNAQGGLVAAILPSMRELSPSEGQYYYNIAEVLQGAAKECNERGIVLSHQYIEKPEDCSPALKDIVSQFKPWGIFDPAFLFRAQYDHISTLGVTFAHAGPPSTSEDPFDCVTDAYAPAVRRAVEHLAKSGRKGVVFVGAGRRDNAHEREKLEATSRARREFGLPDGPEWNIFAEDIANTAGERLLAMRAGGFKFDSILCVNDYTALCAIRAFEHNAISVPGDVAVIGSDDMPGMACSTPPLATIRREREEMGKWLIRLLVERNGNPKAPQKTILVTDTFILRGSAAGEGGRKADAQTNP